MKRALSIFAAVALMAIPAVSGYRINKLLTIASGTPVQASATHVPVRRFLMQAAAATSGALVYICAGITTGVTPSSKCSGTGQLGAQLAAGTSTAPGGSYSDGMSTANTAPIDMFSIWVDGDHTGDTVIVSWDPVQ